MSKQEFIDKYLGKSISKTLTVFFVGTIALFTSNVTGTEWTIIATAYIGATKWTETVLKLKDKI